MPLKCVDNNVFELVNTTTLPRKRKRSSNKLERSDAAADEKMIPAAASCFANAAFSSTPKKLTGKRRITQTTNNGVKKCFQCPILEEKSISDIAENIKQKQLAVEQSQKCAPQTANPYEVLRKPPKKKKRECEVESACFENPALNLDLPEKQFNPFEVPRSLPSTTTTQCFVNAALNLRGEDAPASRNPFEIPRVTPASIAATNRKGVENLGMEKVVPTAIEIGLPFVPTMGCRIDFHNIALSELTPSNLLAQQLAFSPPVPPKRSLDVISEESSMDIGKELDQYQLELENSINEAKQRKNGIAKNVDEPLKTVHEEYEKGDEKPSFVEQLYELAAEEQSVEEKQEHLSEAPKPELSASTDKNEVIAEGNAYDDVVNTSELDEDEIDFKQPTPFVRAYRRADSIKPAIGRASPDAVPSDKADKSEKVYSQEINLKNMKNIIRKSIRKLVHPTHATDPVKEAISVQDQGKPSNILTSIRHSLRRKPPKQQFTESRAPPTLEISIIDTSERKIKLKSSEIQTEFVKIEQLTTERRYTLRNSICRSTRTIMKNVFHKDHEEIHFKSSKL